MGLGLGRDVYDGGWSGFPFVQLVEEGAEVFWKGRFDGMGRASGVGESEFLGVESEAGEEGTFGLFGFGEFEVAFEVG